MPRITKIYTRKGDDGTTALGSRQRVRKDDLRVSTYGTIDELNAVIGLARSHGLEERLDNFLTGIQNDLLHLGSDLAFPAEDLEKWQVPRIEERHILALEKEIDALNEEVGPLQNFIHPGGTSGAAALQLARTVCRRAERNAVTLSHEQVVRLENLQYLNRLSDLLFVMGRYENQQKGLDETLWDSRT